MANPTTNLRVRISADLADIKQGLGLLRGELAKVKTQAAAALPASSANAFTSSIERAKAELVGFIGVYASIAGIKVLAGIADEATLIRGRIKEAKGDYQAILELAQRTRTGLQATTDLYTRIERSTRGRIKNQQELLALTESVNQAIKLSYQGTAQGEAAVLQLGQALGSGKLSGDELRSLSENAPRLVEAIAAGIGKSRGELKKLGAEGKLTTDVVIKALQTQAGVLALEYARVPVTIGDALTQIRNSFVDFIGDQDNATGASRRFAATLQQIAKDLPAILGPVLDVVRLLLENLDVLAVFMVTRLAAGAIPALITAFTALRAALAASAVAAGTLRGVLMLLGGPVGIAIAALAAGLYYLYQRTSDAKRAAEEHTKAMEANRNMAYASRDAAVADATAKRKQALETLNAARAALEEQRIRLRSTQSRTARGGDRGDGAAMAAATAFDKAQNTVSQAEQQYIDWGNRLVEMMEFSDGTVAAAAAATVDVANEGKKAVKGMIDQSELAIDQLKRQQDEIERLFDAGRLSIAAYYAERQRLQLASIDAAITQAQAEAKVATSSEQQSKAMTQIVKLQRDRAEVGPAAAREQAKAEEELAKKLGDVKIRLLELDGETARAARAKLEAEFLELFKQLEGDADETGKALVRKLINREAAKAQLDEFKQEMSEALGSLQGSETSLSAQATAGMVGSAEAERQINVERDAALIKLADLRQKMIDYLATLQPGSPEMAAAIAGLRELDGNIAQIQSSQQKLRGQVADAGISALTNFFVSLGDSTKSASEKIKDFVRDFAASMAQIAARALATIAVLKIMDALWPGSANVVVAGAGVSAGVHHGGGIAGAAGRIRHGLSPLLYGHAPRYHNGGIAGLAPNEVAAVLQRGEEVLTREDPRHRANASPGPRMTTPIVAIGDRAVADALAGAAGEDIVLTHVRNNWEGLTRG